MGPQFTWARNIEAIRRPEAAGNTRSAMNSQPCVPPLDLSNPCYSQLNEFPRGLQNQIKPHWGGGLGGTRLARLAVARGSSEIGAQMGGRCRFSEMCMAPMKPKMAALG